MAYVEKQKAKIENKNILKSEKPNCKNSLIVIINPGNEKTSSGKDYPRNGDGGEGYIEKVLVPFIIWPKLQNKKINNHT
jgi:hypothetical protein